MPKKKYDWYKNPVVEDLPDGTFSYVLTQQMVDQYKEAVNDPHALFPTIAGKHDGRPKGATFEREGSEVNTRTMIECFNAPKPGEKLTVTGRIAGRYIWRGRRYMVTEATCTGEGGRLIDRQASIHMDRAEEVGKKWQ